MQYTSPEEAREFNAALMEKLASTDPMLQKQGADMVTDFTRWRYREEGWLPKILSPIPVSNSDLQRSVRTDRNVIVIDLEPESPAAMMVGYNDWPEGHLIIGRRYEAAFHRWQTPRFMVDTSLLRTYHIDLRTVLSDNALKDLMAAEDHGLKSSVDSILISANAVLPTSGVAQWRTHADMSRDSLMDAAKTLRTTPSHLYPAVWLVNDVTIFDIMKFGRDEAGGDVAQDFFLNGFTQEKINGIPIIITNKHTLVPTGTIYQFAPQNALGKHFVLQDVTMYIRHEAYNLEFFSYKESCAVIGNVNAVARNDFNV